MPNDKIWIVPQLEAYLAGKDRVSNEDIFTAIFIAKGLPDAMNPTQSKRKTVANVLTAKKFNPTLPQYPLTDKRQVWVKRTPNDRAKYEGVIDIELAKDYLNDHDKFEIQEFIMASVGHITTFIQRVAGNYLRGLGYAPRQRRLKERRVSLWSSKWENED